MKLPVFALLCWGSVLALSSRPNHSLAIEIEAVVQAHMDGISLIRQHDVVVEVRDCSEGEKSTYTTHRWSKSQGRERFRTNQMQPETEDGWPVGLCDLFITDSDMRLLKNWDPALGKTLIPFGQGTVRSSVNPRNHAWPFEVPRVKTLLLINFQLDGGKDAFSLKDLVQRATQTDLHRSNTGTWLLVVEEPGGSYAIELDPEKSFYARKVTTKTNSLIMEREVTSFLELDDGLTFPKTIYQRVLSATGGPPVKEYECSVKDFTLNDELPESALNFSFPNYAIVTFGPPKNNQVRAFLWGDDNKPIKELKGPDDLLEYRHMAPKTPRRTWPTVLGGLLIIAAISAVIYYRRRNEAA